MGLLGLHFADEETSQDGNACPVSTRQKMVAESLDKNVARAFLRGSTRSKAVLVCSVSLFLSVSIIPRKAHLARQNQAELPRTN